jgi:Zn-dependent protease with chaperone function
MDFFEQQAKAHHKTRVLVVYFTLAVLSIIVMIYGVFVSINFAADSRDHNDSALGTPATLWDPQLFGWVVLGTLTVIFLGTAYKTMALSSGGSAVAESLGGRLVAPNTNDPDERKLLNIVEEMSIASGVPMPKVYVLDNEDGINAFAAGHTPSDAAVCVTHSCITRLKRDELQGVIGHEFSHILNGDMRMNIRLIGILFGIFCIATIGRILLNTGSGGREKNPLLYIGILLLIVGGLGVFFGRLIQAAVSRQREFLADASSVQFTRNPLGLSSALQKIGGSSSRMTSPHASDASHLFFANGLRSSFFNLMATHPPLEQRIRAIDATWNREFKNADEDDVDNNRSSQRSQPVPQMQDLMQKVLGGAVLASGAEAPPVIRPNSVIPNLGNPTPLHLKYAEELRNALPDSLKAAAREPLAATALIYALLLSEADALRATQVAGLAGRTPPSVSEQAGALFPDVFKTTARARLPLLNLALPALRQLTPSQFEQFSQTLQWLIDSDGEVELFEFVVQKIVLRHLGSQFNGARKPAVQFYTLKPLVPDCAVILSALANVGSENATEIQKAFDAGVPFIRAAENSGLALLPVAQCGIEQLNTSLDRMVVAAPIIKKNLIEACARVVGADGVIQENEAELLRAIADTLDCPMPPLGVSV